MTNPPNAPSSAAPAPKPAQLVTKRNAMLFWILFGIAMAIMLGCTLISLGGDLLESGGIAIVGAIVALIPVPIYVGLFLWLDRFEPEPPHLLVAAFVWGAGIAGLLSCIFNTIIGQIFAQMMSPDLADQLTASISAPLMEEGFKGIAVAILFFWLRDQFDGVIDGIIYAGMTALGFAMIENVAYYSRGLNAGVGQFTVTLFVRGVMSPYAHVLFTSMTGIGFGISRQSRNTLVKFAAPLGGWMAAMALHATWNTLPAILDWLIPTGGIVLFFIQFVVLWIPLFLVLLGIIMIGLRRESRLIKRHLLEKLENSPILPQDAEAASRLLPRLTGNLGVLLSQGSKAWLSLRRYLQATTALAFYRDRLESGRVLANPGLESLYIERIVANRPKPRA